MKRFVLKSIQFCVCILLVYFVIRQIDYEPLKDIFSEIRISFCFLVLATLYFQDLIKALKWFTLLLTKNIRIPLLRILQVDFASTFLTLFVPSSLSLDIFRAYGLGKTAIPRKHAASSIIVDRALSLFALLIVANTNILIFYRVIQIPELIYIAVTLLVMFLSMILFLNSKYFESVWQRAHKITERYKILGKLQALHHSIQEYRCHKKQLIKVFLLSLVMQSCRILVYYFASLAVNADIRIEYFMIFTPVIMFLVMLPISLAGIGLREGSFIYFFGQIGVPPATAFAISALVSVIVIISILPGGLILAFKGLALKEVTTLEERPLVSDAG